MDYQSKVWCPRCDQGWVRRAIIRRNGHAIRICDECDTVWSYGVEVKWPFTGSETEVGGVFFADYVKPYGLRGTWDELELLDPL